jgi:hypothetical protein
VNSEDHPVFGSTTPQQILLRVAEQIGVCSRELALLAQQVEGLRQRLHTLEQACSQPPLEETERDERT